MKTYSTMQIARMAGIGRMTLLRWLKSGRVPEPRRISDGGVEARIWTDRDLKRVRRHKAAHYRKGRGRKPKARRS